MGMKILGKTGGKTGRVRRPGHWLKAAADYRQKGNLYAAAQCLEQAHDYMRNHPGFLKAHSLPLLREIQAVGRADMALGEKGLQEQPLAMFGERITILMLIREHLGDMAAGNLPTHPDWVRVAAGAARQFADKGDCWRARTYAELGLAQCDVNPVLAAELRDRLVSVLPRGFHADGKPVGPDIAFGPLDVLARTQLFRRDPALALAYADVFAKNYPDQHGGRLDLELRLLSAMDPGHGQAAQVRHRIERGLSHLQKDGLVQAFDVVSLARLIHEQEKGRVHPAYAAWVNGKVSDVWNSLSPAQQCEQQPAQYAGRWRLPFKPPQP